MTIRLDKASYDRGLGDGKKNQSSLSQQELISAGFDEWSYLSGFLEGKAWETKADSVGLARDEQAGCEGEGLGCAW